MNQASIELETMIATPTRQKSGEIQFPSYLTPILLSEFTPESLKDLIGGRRLFLRGAAFLGQGLANSLSRLGLQVDGFIDKSPRMLGRRLAGRPVFTPQEVYGRSGLAGEIFVIMASGYWEDEFRAELASAGLAEGRDFISSFDLTPVCPSIDVAGVCNLRCQGCPRGNMETHPPAGFMSAEVYARVIDKLLRELPFLGEVQLYTWGEPLLNPELPEIIGHNQARRVISVVSTNLNLKSELVENLAKAGPEVVRVSCSGWGDNYEITHTGGRWELFLKNTRRLSELNRSLQAGMEMEFYYHIYNHNGGEDYEKAKTLAEELGYVFRPVTANLYPRESIIDLRRGLDLSPSARKQWALLANEAKTMLLGCGENLLDVPCLENRTVAINWNLNVRVCGVCYLPIVADNFLETPLHELIGLVAGSADCAKCAACGAHAFIKPFTADQRLVKGN